jgi:hypothetical protein
MQKIFQNQTVIFYILLGVCLVISRLPWIGRYFRGINTLVHESGHAFMALILSGNVHRIDLSSDTSGSILTSTDNGFKKFLVSFTGYPFSSIVALLFFYFINKNAYQYVIFPLIALAFLNLILYVRNMYGIFWLITFLLLSFSVIYLNNQMLWYGFSLLCAFIILIDSVFSTIQLLIISLRTPKTAGDAKNIADITHFPALFWAAIFLLIAGFLAYKTIYLYFPKIS